MKYSFSCKLYGTVYLSMVKAEIPDKAMQQNIMKEYQKIVGRAKDIGDKNRLLNSYMLAAFFIAMNRNTRLSAEANYQIMKTSMKKSRVLKMAMGNAEGYLSEKKMPGRLKWSQETHQKKYENDWVVDILPKTADYDLGYDYLECGVCKLCRDEGCPELAKYLCRLDFLLAEIMGMKLERTMTLADGGSKCDFRYSRP